MEAQTQAPGETCAIGRSACRRGSGRRPRRARRGEAEPLRPWHGLGHYRDNLKYNSVMTAGSGVRLRVLDANDDRTAYAVQVDKKQ